MEKHRKHAKLNRRESGFYAPTEIAMLGTKCSEIQELSEHIAKKLSGKIRIAYADASHSRTLEPAALDRFTFHSSGDLQIRRHYEQNPYQDKLFYSSYDLLLINGNHYPGKSQIVFLDPEKEASIQKRMDQITDVKLVIKMSENVKAFDCLLEKFPNFKEIPHYDFDQRDQIVTEIKKFANQHVAPIKGLVLAGGQSLRMGQDKGLLNYFGKSQRSYSVELLQKCNLETKLSVRKEQEVSGTEVIEDVFLGLGPFGAICSAFQSDPNAAWLVLATDLPYVDERLIRKLLSHRNPSKIATAVKGRKKEFPEPLVTIWEPKAYTILLQFLAQGISCPRKVLINSEVELLETDDAYIYNVNTPEDFDSVKKKLKQE